MVGEGVVVGGSVVGEGVVVGGSVVGEGVVVGGSVVGGGVVVGQLCPVQVCVDSGVVCWEQNWGGNVVPFWCRQEMERF